VSVSFPDQGDTAAVATSPVAPRAGSAHLAARGRMVLRRFLRNRLAIVGLACVVLLYAVAFLGPLITPWDYAEQDYTAYLEPPSARHWFGTTQIGEDVFAQTVRGLQKSLTIGLLVGLISTSIAAVVGATAGYFGGWVDNLIRRVMDVFFSFPALLLATAATIIVRAAGELRAALARGRPASDRDASIGRLVAGRPVRR